MTAAGRLVHVDMPAVTTNVTNTTQQNTNEITTNGGGQENGNDVNAERRKKNIIIKDLVELGKNGDDRAIEEILGALYCKHFYRQITYAVRLGQYRGRKRPLMVSFTSEEAVN